MAGVGGRHDGDVLERQQRVDAAQRLALDEEPPPGLDDQASRAPRSASSGSTNAAAVAAGDPVARVHVTGAGAAQALRR